MMNIEEDDHLPRSREDLERVLREWNETTGALPRDSGWFYEVLAMMRHAYDLARAQQSAPQPSAEPSAQGGALEPHKYMTAEEYAALDIQGWHMVLKNACSAGSVGIRYLSQNPVTQASEGAGPVAYRYKYKNPFGSDVWSFEVPPGTAVLETQPLYAHPPAAAPVAERKAYAVQEDDGEKLYDTPPPLCDYEVRYVPTAPSRGVEGLTDAQIDAIPLSKDPDYDDKLRFARAIEAAHGIGKPADSAGE